MNGESHFGENHCHVSEKESTFFLLMVRVKRHSELFVCIMSIVGCFEIVHEE